MNNKLMEFFKSIIGIITTMFKTIMGAAKFVILWGFSFLIANLLIAMPIMWIFGINNVNANDGIMILEIFLLFITLISTVVYLVEY